MWYDVTDGKVPIRKETTMIRTNSVTLTTIPGAIAYRTKLPSGGAGIVIIRADEPQPGTATISKTSGEAIVATNTPTDAYPAEAFAEAIELTYGMPYRKQGKPKAPFIEAVPETDTDVATSEEAGDEDIPEAKLVAGEEYQKIVDAYTDKKGRLSYDLLNKDLIKLAHHSDYVAGMIADGASEQDIWLHVVGTRFAGLTGNDHLTESEVVNLATLIDEVSPKGAFKELNAKIREMLGEAKRQK